METSQKTELKTLAACMNKLQSDGFKENFVIKEGTLKSVDSEKSYEPSQVKINNFYRFEGESDPADNAILYAIETTDGMKGLICDAYGAYADEGTSKFIADVQEIMKKTNPEEKV